MPWKFYLQLAPGILICRKQYQNYESLLYNGYNRVRICLKTNVLESCPARRLNLLFRIIYSLACSDLMHKLYVWNATYAHGQNDLMHKLYVWNATYAHGQNDLMHKLYVWNATYAHGQNDLMHKLYVWNATYAHGQNVSYMGIYRSIEQTLESLSSI